MTGSAYRPSRRHWLGAVVAAAASPARAADLARLYAWYPTIAGYVLPALHDLRAHRYMAAAARLASANALIDADAAARWPYRCYVQPPYALALFRLGRADEAAALLRQSVAARDGIMTDDMGRFADIMNRLDASLGLELTRIEYLRELLSAIRTGDAVRRVDELPGDDGAGAADLWMLLPQVLDASGAREELRRLYAERFAAVDVDANDHAKLVAHEYRLHAFGRALYHAGFAADAADAWRRGRAANARRIDNTMRLGAPHSVFAACTVRRVQLSNAVLAAHADGQLERQRIALVADILVTKSAGARYAGTMQLALARQAPDAAAALARLEDRIARLPAAMTDPLPFLRLLAEHDLVSLRTAEQIGFGKGGFDVPADSLVAGLQARLGDAAAVGFMLVDEAGMQAGATPPRRYLRFCVSRTEVQLRLLGSQAFIDRLVRASRTEYLGGAAASPAGARLAAELFADLPDAVATAGEWLLEPDGALHLAPFDALPDADGQPLLQRRLLRFVTSLAQLPGTLAPVSGGAAVILADPACGTTGAVPAPGADAGLRWSSDSVPLGSIPPLPEARREARTTAAALARIGIDSQIIVGADATTPALQRVRQPAVLHIAAHAVLRAAIDAGAPAQQDNALDLLLPGRQAGLVLARPGGGPDLFLAQDMARLALQGTALVVLSACNSANGDVVVGEGVSSLRRATELAGALSAVATVWQVPSDATTELMCDFYDHLARGASIGAALRAAKLAALARGAPPRAWAGFQLSGADGPLGRPA